MLTIKKTDLVLEIGSGNRPRKRANVLCDKFLHDNTERSGGDEIVIDQRPFVVADGLALPFKDKSFDYVITSHILEHVDDPVKFASELSRIARAGYIETPSELGEKIFGWPFHKWLVRREGNTLVLRRRLFDSPFGKFFHSMYANDRLFAEFVDSHFEHFYVQYEWHGSISIRIEDDPDGGVRFNSESKKIETSSRSRQAGIRLVRPILLLTLRGLRLLRKFG
jgi:SAM-dependent methyltransferase